MEHQQSIESKVDTFNPFTQHLQPNELLIWAARPDQIVYMQGSWRYFRAGSVFGCFVAAACVLGMLFSDDRFQEAACVFVIA